MSMRPHVILAVFKRNFLSYFSSPIGYLFVVAFVGLMAYQAFTDEFFADNQATLDHLNVWFSLILLFIVPAIAMTSWSEEKKQGTDELLFTLPAQDVEILLGKYLALLAIYTAALCFSFVFGTSFVLKALTGKSLFNPLDFDFDVGLIFSNYLGYWFAGAALLGAGMVASALTSSPTVAFILGAIICALPVTVGKIQPGSVLKSYLGIDGLTLDRFARGLSIDENFRDFGLGIVPLSGVLYFASLAGFMLYINRILISKRHWSGGPYSASMGWQFLVRTVALAIILISTNVIASSFAGMRFDFTGERIYSVFPKTREILYKVNPKRPVVIQAFISPQVPAEYVITRSNLIGLLRQYDQIGGDNVRVRIVDTEQFSTAADEAKGYGINPQVVQSQRGGKFQAESIFMGCVVSSGSDQEVVIPFFDKGTPVEYELTRSIQTISSDKERRKVGILTTDSKLFGGFDPATFQQSPEWRIVTELKKQYLVEQVVPDGPITGKYDVLIAAMPSSLTEPQMQHFVDYVKEGKPTLIFDDPIPFYSQLRHAPRQPKPSHGGGGPFGGGQQPPQPKADGGKATRLVNMLGIAWDNGETVYDLYNPHPEYPELDPELVWISAKSGASGAFNKDNVVTSGMQEMLLPFPGTIRKRDNSGVDFIPLLRTSERSGTVEWSAMVRETPNFFGMGGPQIIPDRVRPLPDAQQYVLAARLKSAKAASDKEGAGEKIDAIYVADLDMIADWFFDLREREFADLKLDNIPFVLNCVDELAGDGSLIDLRKRRARQRTLTAVEASTQQFIEKRNKEQREAEDEAKGELEEAKKRLSNKIAEVDKDNNLDQRAKAMKKQFLQQEESRRLTIQEAEIDNKKKARVELARDETEREIRRIERLYGSLAVWLPPIPALILGILVFLKRRGDEQRGINADRLVKR